MALSLHAEYLLGYLAGARSLAPRDVIPFARIDAGDGSAQTRALVKALALGVAEGRKGMPVRDASDVRIRVLAMLSRDTSNAAALGAATAQADAELAAALRDSRASEPDLGIDALIAAGAAEGR